MENRVGMRLRALVLLIDAVMLWVIIAGTQQLGMLAASVDPGGRNMQVGKRWVGVWFLMLVAPPLAAVMYSACDVFFAATPGRALLRLRIAHESGRRASRGQLLTRWAIKYAPLIAVAGWIAYFSVHVAVTNGRGLGGVVRANYFVMPVIGVIAIVVAVGGLLIFRKPAKQALHDRLAHTAVFRKADISGASFEPVFAAAGTSEGEVLTPSSRYAGERAGERGEWRE
jgi:uncharacterized RDD family membrane protein YckC